MKKRMKELLPVAAILACAMATNSAWAITIVDTGPGPVITPGLQECADPGVRCSVLDNEQSLAAALTLDRATTITGIEGWLYADPSNLEPVSISVRYDDSGSPGDVLYASQFNLESLVSSWQGLSELSWALSAGDYWISFSTAASANAATITMPGPPPDPVSAYAFTDLDGSWVNSTSLAFGLRVSGTEVPLPGAGLYLLSALLVSVPFWRSSKNAKD